MPARQQAAQLEQEQAGDPRSLKVAYVSLLSALDESIELYRRTLRFPKSASVIDGIERFIHEIVTVPNWLAELERRVSLVETACGVASDYATTRKKALDGYSASPRPICRGQSALERLHSDSTAGLHFLAEVIDVRKNVEAVLEEPSLGLSPAAMQAFADWGEACRRVQLQAERLEVDGCWYLYHVYRAAEPNASDGARAAKAMLQTNMGGTHVESVRLAARAMAAWIWESGILPAEQLRADVPPTEIEPDGSKVLEEHQEPRVFSGGKMVFYPDRVELCGVDICSGSRCERYRRTLDLLAKKNRNGGFTSCSGEVLAKAVGVSPGEKDAKKQEGSAAGLIRHLRSRIRKALRSQANLECGKTDVILSGGPKYRFSDRLSVHHEVQPDNADITDTDGTGNVSDVRNARNDRNDDDRDVRNTTQQDRRAWILQRLAEEHPLKAPDVVEQFKCGLKTAERDLKYLKDKGEIEFVGAPRTGNYRLPEAPGTDP